MLANVIKMDWLIHVKCRNLIPKFLEGYHDPKRLKNVSKLKKKVLKFCSFVHPGIFGNAMAKRFESTAPNLSYKFSRLRSFSMQNFEHLYDYQVCFFNKKCPKNRQNYQNFGFLGINTVLSISGSQNLA